MAMNFSLSKLPWYSQIGAFFALALLATGVFWTLYAQPAHEDLNLKSQQLDSMRAEIARGQDTARRLPAFRKEIAGLEAQLERLRAVLPEEQDVADLLRRVQGMATQSNLTIRGFTPQTVARKQMHMEWPIGLQLEGTYHDLGDFLERVSKFPRIINVGNIQVRAKDASTGPETITADCVATTFVLLDTPAPAAATAASAKAGAE
jgi:type IV pilus assembly protein PilO